MDVNRVSQKRDASVPPEANQRREARSLDRSRSERTERVEAPETPKTRPAESAEKPKPVVNTQGQTTGTRINTSA